MLEQIGDLWERHGAGFTVLIPTNGIVRKNGCLVMGKGVAGQAKYRFPGLAQTLGAAVSRHGNHVLYCRELYRLVAFPTKNHWVEEASLLLIERSAVEAVHLPPGETYYLPRVGCGLGKLKWPAVKAVLAPILPDNFIVLHDGVSQD